MILRQACINNSCQLVLSSAYIMLHVFTFCCRTTSTPRPRHYILSLQCTHNCVCIVSVHHTASSSYLFSISLTALALFDPHVVDCTRRATQTEPLSVSACFSRRTAYSMMIHMLVYFADHLTSILYISIYILTMSRNSVK